MRVAEPRIPPLEPEQWDATAKEAMGRFPPLNLFKTLANHPALTQRWMTFGSYILAESTLSGRDRELIILRIAYRCRAEYEWGQHVLIARKLGLTDDEIRRITTTDPGTDPGGNEWTEAERLLLKATDELHSDSHVGDATWQGLASHFTTQQLMDFVFTVGEYVLIAMALNSFGVQADPGMPGFDISP
ncbi:MAG: carboxymuconolactone decarboxylase family protein [Proteobacteria bacterium]|nr:carboxymuconolactone decarboxylase family protein [Pseudomonadota bacterium]